jgi:hypothetical protein
LLVLLNRHLQLPLCRHAMLLWLGCRGRS